jgi:glycosidase
MQWSAEDHAGFTTGTPWEPVNADYPEVNVADQSGDPASLLSRYRELIHLRQSHPALQTGDYHPVESRDEAVLAFLRTGPTEILLVVINLSDNPVSAYDLALGEGPLSGTYQATLLYGGEADLPDLPANASGGFDSYLPLSEIPGGGTLIIELKPNE